MDNHTLDRTWDDICQVRDERDEGIWVTSCGIRVNLIFEDPEAPSNWDIRGRLCPACGGYLDLGEECD